MKANELKPIQAGYGEEQVIFHLRMISVAEEADYDVRFADISESDEQRFDKQFDLCKKALGEFASSPPQKIVKTKGEQKRELLVADATAADAIEQTFKQRTLEHERIIRRVYGLFKTQLDPDIRFL